MLWYIHSIVASMYINYIHISMSPWSYLWNILHSTTLHKSSWYSISFLRLIRRHSVWCTIICFIVNLLSLVCSWCVLSSMGQLECSQNHCICLNNWMYQSETIGKWQSRWFGAIVHKCSYSDSGILSACAESDGPVGMLLASLKPFRQLGTLDEYIRWKHWDSYNLDGLQLMQMFLQWLRHDLGICQVRWLSRNVLGIYVLA
jgi:hypothetical protein